MADSIRDEVIIALVDLSGSMAGPAISKINVQLAELLSELQSMQDLANNSIRLGILGFQETASWVIRPEQVKQITNLPQFKPVYGADMLGARSSYAGMLAELNKCMTERFLCETRALNSVHVLLFTDGCPTDRKDVLDKAMEDLKKNPVFSNSHTKRYVIEERTEGIRFRNKEDYMKAFAGDDLNVISADDFSALLGNITGELEGIKKMKSVFD